MCASLGDEGALVFARIRAPQKPKRKTRVMNSAIYIGLVAVGLALSFMDSPFASIAFFVVGLFHLFKAAEGGKTSKGYKYHLVLGMFLVSLAHTGEVIVNYMNRATIQVYEDAAALERSVEDVNTE